MKHTTTLLWLFSLSKTTTRCMRAKARLLFYSSVRLVVAMTRVSRLRVETCSSFVVLRRRLLMYGLFSFVFFSFFFLCVCCVCVFCVKTEEEEVSVLFLFFVSKNFIIIVLFQARFFRYIHQINFTSYRRIIRYRTMGMTTTTTLFARVLERRQHQHQHHERRARRRICSSSTKKSFSIKSHKVVSTQNNNNNNEEEEIKTTSRRRGREDGKCSFSRLASTTAVCFAASMTVATSTVILPVGGNTDFFSARADEQVEKCTKTVREKYA